MEQSMTGAAFLAALTQGTLKEPVVREGMVKLDTTDPAAVLFAAGTACGSWTKIPVDMIDKVEYLTVVGCRDHTHPFIRLSLKEPPSDNTMARVLADLVRHTPQSERSVQSGGGEVDTNLVLEGGGAYDMLKNCLNQADEAHDRCLERCGDARDPGWCIRKCKSGRDTAKAKCYGSYGRRS